MLTHKELEEIKVLLENSQNPIFFFDNDVDGLCSFLILQRALGRGKGVQIKSFPELDKTYVRRVEELNSDAVFILDKPRVSEAFIQEISEKNLPIIWIDHHNVQTPKEILEKVYYFNPAHTSNTAEPTTYLAQKVFNRKEDLWLAMIGCISDVHMPEFANEFAKNNPELFPVNSKISAFDSLYLTEIGKIIAMLNFALKDTTTNVVKLIKYLTKATSAYDILEENQNTKYIHYKYKKLNEVYQKIIKKAEQYIKTNKHKKLIFFEYSGQFSMSSEVSNEIFFKNKDKLVVVAYNSNHHAKINISIRGKRAKEITEKAIKDIEGASGGGHEEATGATIPQERLEDLKKEIIRLVEHQT